MKISFTERELGILKVWGDNVIHGGHWGDGDVVFPDESILLGVLEEARDGQPVVLSKRNIDIMLIWAESGSGVPEEDLLKNRLLEYQQAFPGDP